MSATQLLKRAAPGAPSAVHGHIIRGEKMVNLINDKWKVDSPGQWKAKQVRWVLEVALKELSPASRYDYWRTARLMASALGHWPDWEPHLRGPWCRRGAGGRPPLLTSKGALSKARYR
jgi:hypothetical protein